MKPGKNLIISFVMILIFGLYFFILTYENKKQAEVLNGWVIHTHLVIGELNKLNTLITEFEAQDQAYVIENNKQFSNDINTRNQKATAVFDRIKTLIGDNPAQQNNFQHLLQVISAKIAYRTNVLNVLKTSQPQALLLLADPESDRLYLDIKKVLGSMLDVENQLLTQRTAKHEQVLQERLIYTITFELFGLTLLGIAFWRIYKESVNRKSAEEEAHRSENKYKGLIEKSSLIIFTTDLHGRFTYISDKGVELTGYEREELIGKTFNILVPPDGKNEISRFYASQYKHYVKDLVEEFEICSKDNKIKIIQLSTVLIHENNEVAGFQSIAKDVTEVKYVESLIKESKLQLLQQQEEYNLRMQSVLNNIPMILYIKDLDGRYIMINKNFGETFSVRDEEIIGKTNREMERFRERAAFFDNVDLRVKYTGKPVEFEEVMRTDEGMKNFLVTKFPLFDKNKEIFAISSVAKDITEMTEQRQQLIDARLKAEKAEQLQESFLANMSHEIRTPMNGVIGMTNLLLDTNLDDEQKEYAELIKKSSDNLLILINDILDLSKIKAGRMELETIDFNIREAVRNVLQPLKMNLKKNVELNYSIDEAVPDFVKGDSHKLFQILNNLLSNAAKFTEKGEIKVNVSVVEKSDETVYVRIDVADSGIGISENHVKSIFESFTQAGNDTVRRFGGTGLGLAITKRLIEMQNGTIQVESAAGVGSVFHVEIPYLLADIKPVAAINNTNSDINIIRDAIENKKILIVEDNLVNQKVLTSVLQKWKVKWDIANNGQDAVDTLERGNKYDLIIMDLQMPVMDGFQATVHIRKKLKISTPIIAMTASTLRNERVKCFSIGMNEYVAKPFSPTELMKHIHHLINTTDKKEKQMEKEQLTTEKLYDLAFLHEMEDNDYLIEMIELFFETTSEMLDEMQDNVRNKNWDNVSRIAHKLKSSLGPLQVTRMITLATAIEQNSKQKNNVEDISSQYKELQHQYKVVKPLIELELAKAKRISNGFVLS